MQINDITAPATEQLTEAGMLDYAKAMITKDPALANLNVDQRIAAMQRDTALQNVAKQTLQQWQGKVVTLQRANQNLPISDQEYTNNLKDFVENVLLQKPLTTLDQPSRQRLGQQINTVLAARNDAKALTKAFDTLVVSTAAARQDPARLGRTQQNPQTAGQRQQPPAGSAQVGAAKQVQPLVKQFLNRSVGQSQINGMQQFLQQNSGATTVRSTGNALIDAFINQLGIKTQ